MHKKYLTFFVLFVFVLLASNKAGAQTTTTATTTATTTVATTTISIIDVNKQILDLTKQMADLRAKLTKLLVDNVELIKTDPIKVKLLQELLAGDKTIYPEGIITGTLGNLTTQAIVKYANKNNIALKGPMRLIQQGAGKSGQVPAGLLTAPGIQKKMAPATSSSSTNGILNGLKNIFKKK